MYDDAYTRNDDDKLAVRTVSSSGDNNPNKDDVFTRDNEGRLSMRIVGGSGGGGDVDYSKTVRRSDTIPAASASNVGQVYLYTGATNANFTQNYIYKNVKSATTYTGTVSFEAATLSGTTVTCSGDNFANFLTESGVEPLSVVSGTMTFDSASELWALVGKDSGGNTVLTFQEYQQDFVDAGFTFTGTPQDGDVVAFTCTVEEASATYAWERIDVQPAGGTGNVSSVNGKTGIVVLDAKDVNAIPQYDTMPEATVSNVGEIAQYSGETIPDVPASAVATQTVGSGLSDLLVDVDTFVGVEQPSGVETVNFVATVSDKEIVGPTTTYVGPSRVVEITITNPSAFVEKAKNAWDEQFGEQYGYFEDVVDGFRVAVTGDDSLGTNVVKEIDCWVGDSAYGITPVFPDASEWYIQLSPTPKLDSEWGGIFDLGNNVGWSKNGTAVDLASYGVSYSGTPVSGDTISVAYTPFVAGITNGYFYKSSVEYDDPTATISQTVGSSLTDLSVNVDRFVEAEQPTQSGNTSFVADVVESSVVFNVVAGNFTVSIPYWGLRQLFIDKGFNWDDISLFWDAVFNFYSATQCGFGPSAGSDWVFIEDIATTAPNYGLVITGSPDPELGNNYATYSARDGSTTWSKNGVTVDLSAYGVSYNNTPNNGDTLTVAYVAPSVVGYGWNQINVQPSSGADIEWETKVDLPAEYTGNENNAEAYFTIKNGLPDGEYEFYYSVKVRPNSDSLAPDGEVIYKVKFKIDNSLNQAMGSMGYVFDGNYMNSGAKEYGGIMQELWGWCRKNNDDLIIYSTGNVFTTDILAMNSHQAVSECFKLSAIKNVETGEKYIAEGNINLDGSEPEITDWVGGNLILRPIVSVYIPTRAISRYWSLSDFLNNQSVFVQGDDYAFLTLSMIHEGSNSEFIVNLIGKGGVNINPYSQEIVKATGVFSNCHLEVDNNHRVWVIGVNAPTTATGMVKVCLGGLTQNSVDMGFEIIPTTPTITPIAQIGPQGAILGTITAETIGNVIQYVGDTNSSYTNGYFYKANGTVVTVLENMEITVMDPVGEATVTINVTNLIDSMNSVFGWEREQIVQWIIDYPNDWRVYFNVDNNTVTRMYAPFYGDFYDSRILQSVSVAYTGSSTGEVDVSFNESYTPESKTVQNPSWDRVDVQPLDLTGVAGYDATKTQVLKNIQGTLTWVDE